MEKVKYFYGDGYNYCKKCGSKLITTSTECISWFEPDMEPYKAEEYIELDTIDESFYVYGIYCEKCEKFTHINIDSVFSDDVEVFINDKEYKKEGMN